MKIHLVLAAGLTLAFAASAYAQDAAPAAPASPADAAAPATSATPAAKHHHAVKHHAKHHGVGNIDHSMDKAAVTNPPVSHVTIPAPGGH